MEVEHKTSGIMQANGVCTIRETKWSKSLKSRSQARVTKRGRTGLMSKVPKFMDTVNIAIKKRIARYLDAILYISGLLLISSLLEIIKA